MLLTEGDWKARAVDGAVGNKKEQLTVRVNFELLEGPNVGQRATYEGLVTNKSAPYVSKDLRAAGWSGHDLDTLRRDIETKQSETVIRIATKEWTDKKTGELRKFSVVQSIGRGQIELSPPAASDMKEANTLLRAAVDADIPF